MATPESRENAMRSIENELQWWKEELEKDGRRIEAARLWQRTKFDLEMIKQIGALGFNRASFGVFRDRRRPRCWTICRTMR